MTRIAFVFCLWLTCFNLSLFAQTPKPAAKPSKIITYKKIDTTELKLTFYYPKVSKKNSNYPAILFFFGGGWINGNVTQFEPAARYFASRGIIAVLADYRIASKHKTTVFEAVKDAKSAMRYLREHAQELNINSNKIVAAGGSAGGHLAAATDLVPLEEVSDKNKISARPNALILFNPVYDNGPTGYGYERIGNRYLEVSPMHNIKKGAAPTIVFLGTKDKLVSVETATHYKNKLEAVGTRCELFLYPDQLHGFFNFNPKNGNQYFLETIKQADIFLESMGYLKGKPTIESFPF